MQRTLGVLLFLFAAFLAGCGGDADDDAVKPPSTTTAVAPTSPTTATPTTSAEPTTTTTGPIPSAIALRGDGLGVVALGAAPDAAIAAVTAGLGEPSLDTGWEPSFSSYGTCPGEQIRGVEWGGLVLLFTDGDTSHGSGQHLFSWRVTGAPPSLGTPSGLGFGSSAADAEELYPGRVETVPAEDPFPGFLQIDAEGGRLTAFLGDAGEITNLEAGTACGE